MKRLVLSALLAVGTIGPASAANVVKTYSYYRIGGKTLDEIETQLAERGPEVKTTGLRHPGATQMSFSTRIGYAERPGSCRIGSAVVTVKAKVILPLWRQRRHADAEVRLFWDTLFADIKRHEDRHVEIAKNHARELEDALKATWSFADCEQAAAKAKEMTVRMLARHEKAQVRFDRVERINFESRILRLLKYRLETIESRRSRG